MTTLAKSFLPASEGSKSLVGSLLGLGLQELAQSFARVSTAWAAKRRKDRAYAELMHLDGRMLSDIGLDRGDVYAVVYGDGLKDTARDAFEKAHR